MDERMATIYFKRYRMERDLTQPLAWSCTLPPGYTLVPWTLELLPDHALAKYFSFRTELDANVFPCLRSREGCLNLMEEIASYDESLMEKYLNEEEILANVDDPNRYNDEVIFPKKI